MTFPTLSASDWRAAMHRGRSERNVVMDRIRSEFERRGLAMGRLLLHGKPAPSLIHQLSAQEKAAGFQPAAKQIQKP